MTVFGRSRFWLALAVLVVFCGIGVVRVKDMVAQESGALATVADHRASMLAAWFAERAASAGLSATSFPQAELYVAWQVGGDLHARDRLVMRLTQFAEAGGFSEVALLAEDGRLLWSSAGRGEDGMPWTGLDAWAGGAAPGTFGHGSLRLDEKDELHVHFVAALPTAPAGPTPVVVYHADSEAMLPERLARGVTRHGSATVVVFGRVEGGVAGLARPAAVAGGRTGEADQVVTWFLGEDATSALAVRLATGDLGPLQPASGSDHRGVRVVGAGREVGDTGWFVLAQVDRSELSATIIPAASFGLLLAVLAYGAGLYALQRLATTQRAAIALATERAEAERVRSERLLAAIADASPDAIFAKDLDGRYLFINRAGSDIVGRSSAEVIGMTDRELFPKEQADDLRAAERELVATGGARTFEEVVDTTAGRRVFSATKGGLRGADGHVYGTFGISRDVTDWRTAQRVLEQQAHDLAEHVEELERFNRVLVDRELVMVTLKRQINAYASRLGEAEPFPGVDALLGDEASDD